MPKTHPTYQGDFREEAVNLLLSSGRPLKRVAAELGISATMRKLLIVLNSALKPDPLLA